MLDEIINHVQSLQKQVEVRNPQPSSFSHYFHFTLYAIAVLVDETGGGESRWNRVERDRQFPRSGKCGAPPCKERPISGISLIYVMTERRNDAVDDGAPQAGPPGGSPAQVVRKP